MMKKQKKGFLIGILIITIFFSLRMHSAVAVIRVPYPDPKSLQPKTPGVSPNISGNVDSTTGQVESTNIETQEQNNTPIIETEAGKTNWILYAVYAILTILLIFVVVFIYRKRRQE